MRWNTLQPMNGETEAAAGLGVPKAALGLDQNLLLLVLGLRLFLTSIVCGMCRILGPTDLLGVWIGSGNLPLDLGAYLAKVLESQLWPSSLPPNPWLQSCTPGLWASLQS